MDSIVIVGAGIAAHLAACYFKRKLTSIDVVVLGTHDTNRPIVGESTVEVTTHFLEALGLGSLLEERHYHKYGLTYYFKQNPDPQCRRYVVHEAPGVIRLPAYNLNRFTFDRDLHAFARSLGVRFVDAKVTDLEVRRNCEAPHVITGRTSAGQLVQERGRFLVDASGRSRILASHLKLKQKARVQRSSFWFRLSGFDRSRLSAIEAVKEKHLAYDSYYVTHHFFGRGYWVWLIPIRAEDGRDLISIGLTYRAEMLRSEIRDLDGFLALMQEDHPVINELVASGRIEDQNLYRNYMYEAQHYYSATDRWFLLGDAAFTFDPSNSAGLAYLAHQIPQLAAIFRKDLDGVLCSRYVHRMERHVRAQLALQDTWSRWYDVMDDPLRMPWLLMVANLAYFHVVLPNYVNGSFLDGNEALRFANRLPRFAPLRQPAAYPFDDLLDVLQAQARHSSAELTPNLYDRTINWSLYHPDESTRARYASDYFVKLGRLRLELLRKVSAEGPETAARFWTRHLHAAASDLLRGLALRLAPSLYHQDPRPTRCRQQRCDHESCHSPAEPPCTRADCQSVCMASPFTGKNSFLSFPDSTVAWVPNASAIRSIPVIASEERQ